MELTQHVLSPMPLDLALVEDTTGEDPREFLADMLPIFLEDMPEQIAGLRGAVQQGDLTTAERTAHAMKSSSAWIGATEFSDNCRRMESAARGQEAALLAGLFERIARDYTRIVLWVEQQQLV